MLHRQQNAVGSPKLMPTVAGSHEKRSNGVDADDAYEVHSGRITIICFEYPTFPYERDE